MGFIERLRQQKEAEEQVRRLRAAELGSAQQAERVAKQQREAEEKDLHRQRREQAQAFLDESGFSTKLEEFGKLIRRGSYIQGGNFPKFDPDSEMRHFAWDQNPIKKDIVKKGWPGTWDYIVGKHIAIEICPNGTFIFYGAKGVKSTISRETWIENNQILDERLENAYTNPLIETAEVQNIPRHIVGMS